MLKNDDLCLFVMDNCNELGSKVNQAIQVLRSTKKDYRVSFDLPRFNDGEAKVTLKESIRGKDVYILSDTHNYGCTYEMYGMENRMSPDEHYQDIKRVILAMMGHAKSIKVIMPLLYASRQHRRKGRESLDCALALQELEHLGVDNIITFDAHDPNVANAIPTLSFDNFYAIYDMLSVFLKNEEINLENTLVISPDTGAMDRARFFADILKVDVGLFYKRRDLSKLVDGYNPIVAHEYLGKSVKNKVCIVIDDMIASGGSMIDVAKELKARGAEKVFFFATFALFTKGVKIFDDAFEENLFHKIYSTNLTYIPHSILEKKWLKCADCSNYLANIIDVLNEGRSVSELILNFDDMKTQSVKKKSNGVIEVHPLG